MMISTGTMNAMMIAAVTSAIFFWRLKRKKAINPTQGEVQIPKQDGWFMFRNNALTYCGEPDNQPKELIKFLKDFFSNKPNITKAYLAQVFVKGNPEPPHPVIIIDAGNDTESLIIELVPLIKRFLAKEYAVDFMKYEKGTLLSDTVEKNLSPFYINTQLN